MPKDAGRKPKKRGGGAPFTCFGPKGKEARIRREPSKNGAKSRKKVDRVSRWKGGRPTAASCPPRKRGGKGKIKTRGTRTLACGRGMSLSFVGENRKKKRGNENSFCL